MYESNAQDPFQAVKDAAERAKPTGWRWPDKSGNAHDGPELIGEYVADDRSDRHDVDIRVVRTSDGQFRSLFLWQPDDGEEQEYHLPARWRAAGPQLGDYVCVIQHKRQSMANEGQSYNDFQVVAVRPADLETPAIHTPVAGVDEATEAALVQERDERDSLVDDHGAPIPY